MNKEEIVEMAQSYSRISLAQMSYLAGFQAACNIIRCKLNTCDNAEFCDEMEELAQIAFMDLNSDD